MTVKESKRARFEAALKAYEVATAVADRTRKAWKAAESARDDDRPDTVEALHMAGAAHTEASAILSATIEALDRREFSSLLPDVERLAHEFASIVSGWLSSEERRAVLARNADPDQVPGVCATHDFCDPNQAMLDAWEKVAAREHDLHSDREVSIVNRAWTLARKNQFWFPEATP